MKEELVKINKMFTDGTIRYDGDLENLEDKPLLDIARIIAEKHPFINGNKRTAIKFMELRLGKEVPTFVYDILQFC